MLTFLFATGIRSSDQSTLAHAAKVVPQVMPRGDLTPKLVTTHLADCDMGWFRFGPEENGEMIWLGEAVEQHCAVVSYGELAGVTTSTDVAQQVLRTWESEGASGVSSLNGSFSAIIVDRKHRTVDIATDTQGLRSLRYIVSNGRLFVSPHDVTLVATGQVLPRLDTTSVSSCLALGWSLGNTSLLQGVRSHNPTTTVRFASGDTRATPTEHLFADRIDVYDTRRVQRHLNLMLEVIHEEAAQVVKSRDQIGCDLTAGIDSRSVLALLLAVAKPSRLKACCGGANDSTDVTMARRIANHYRVAFVHQPVDTEPNLSDILRVCDQRTFFENGDSTVALAEAADLRDFPLHIPPASHGTGKGGEIFTGWYYPRRQPASSNINNIVERMKRRTGFHELPWRTPELLQDLETRMQITLETLRDRSSDYWDILDMWFLFEHMGTGGCGIARCPWLRYMWSPYLSPRLIRLAYQLPSPIGSHCNLQMELIRRHAKYAWWQPVNGDQRPALVGNRLYQRALRKAGRVWMRQKPMNQGQRAGASHMSQRSDAVGTILANTRDELTEPSSGIAGAFGDKALRRLIDDHCSGNATYTTTLGSATAMERFRRLVQQTYDIASQYVDSPAATRCASSETERSLGP